VRPSVLPCVFNTEGVGAQSAFNAPAWYEALYGTHVTFAVLSPVVCALPQMVCDPHIAKRLTMRNINRSRPVQLRTETQQDMINTTGLAAARCVCAAAAAAAIRSRAGHTSRCSRQQPLQQNTPTAAAPCSLVSCVFMLPWCVLLCVWSTSGELWRTMRLAWQPAFQSGSLEGYTDLMDDCAAQLAEVRHYGLVIP
jgi:cytochrome P450